MRAKKIVLATDLSNRPSQAPGWATALAHETGATLLIVHVEPGQPTSNFGAIYQGLSDPGIAETAQKLAAIRPTQADVAYEHRILRGDPADELLKLAEAEAIDAIVVDAHPEKHLWHALGGTAEALVRRAPCPVMVCRS
jgi:nucleotide-binding universal stress UspA family protein